MRRWVYAQRYVRGEPQALERTLLREVDRLIRVAAVSPDQVPAADGSYVIELATQVAGLEVAKHVRVRTGVAFRSGHRVLLPLSWHAEPARVVFPAFEGTEELEPLDNHTAALSLAGSYKTPLGPVGGLADATALHRIAVDTAERLVAGLATQLTWAVAGPPHIEESEGPRRGEPLRVGDVMTADPIMLDAEMPLRTAALLLFHGEISGAPVVTVTGELVGVLSEGDLLAKEATVRFGLGREGAAEDRRRDARTAGQACTRPRILDTQGATGVHVSVHAGEVTLSGRAERRSVVERLPDVVAAVDGVLAVETADLQWEDDDILPPVPYV